MYSMIKKIPGIRKIVERFHMLDRQVSDLNKKIQNLEKNSKEQQEMLEEQLEIIERQQKAAVQQQEAMNRLKAKLEASSKVLQIYRNEIENEFENQLHSIKTLENEFIYQQKILADFKGQYGRERYEMQLDMRTNLYKALPEEKYAQELKNWYLLSTGKILDLENPKTYNEKIQWLKLYEHDERKTRLSDKYLVREWIKETIGESYLVPLLGVWRCFDDIDFSELPDKFVLKANHGCGYNIIVKDKSMLNKKEAKEKFDRWLATNFAYVNFEMHYKNIQPLIIAEEYIENEGEDLYDYKVWCFHGQPKYIMFLANRKKGLKMVFYDTEWNRMPFTYSVDLYEEEVPKPDNLEELLEISRKLSKDFKHVRVDFYRLNDGSYKFGEMTFSSAAGKAIWHPEEYDRIFGDMLEL